LNKKLSKTILSKTISVIFVFANLLALSVSISGFFTGLHNIDIATNRFYLAYYNNRYLGFQDTVENYCDEAVFTGSCNNYRDVYLNGTKMVLISFLFMVLIVINLLCSFVFSKKT